MIGETATVLIRQVPEQFRGPGFTHSGNNVYQFVEGAGGKVARKLVGQLEQGTQARLPIEQAARFFGGGGQLALQALSAVGSVASIANLGVCVVGFIHVSRGLKRVEKRLERVEQKLDVITELVGILDQKVDQIAAMAKDQLSAITSLHALIVSFQTAKVHRALETLELRVGRESSPLGVAEIMAAAGVLHEYRLWLAQQRVSEPGRVLPARAELLRAEVMVAIAEARARCSVGDAAFASRELELVLEGARTEADWMRQCLQANGGFASVLSCNVPGIDDMHAECVDAIAWLDRRSKGHAQRFLLREATHAYNDLAHRVRTMGRYANYGAGMLAAQIVTYREQGFFGVSAVSDADAASFLLAARLGKNLEGPLAMCAAIDVLGEAGRRLIDGGGDARATGLIVELVAQPA